MNDPEGAEKKGQIERITGQGFSGTFGLVDGADKTGSEFEDAFENAIIAMNDPKDLSVAKLRDYLGVYHPEYNTDERPIVLKRALERAAGKGWLKQISGRGFSGSYRLMYPYYPSPKELWGNEYEEREENEDREASPKKKTVKRKADSADDKSATKKKVSKKVIESDEEEEAYKPKATKRGAPKPRTTVVAPKKKPISKVAKKQSSKPASKGVPVKKAATPKAKKGAARGKK